MEAVILKRLSFQKMLLSKLFLFSPPAKDVDKVAAQQGLDAGKPAAGIKHRAHETVQGGNAWLPDRAAAGTALSALTACQKAAKFVQCHLVRPV